MTTKNTQLYFVALVPSKKVYEQTMSLKNEVAERFGSRAALRSPPHITLHMPFKWREDKENLISATLQSFATEQKPLKILHQGFGAFAPRVIFVNVEKTTELDQFRTGLVKLMRRELKLENADYKEKAFHPHMTIAFRDLKKRDFPEAWAHYKDQMFDEEWDCDQLTLLKHNGKSWDIFQQYRIGSE